ncbi:MAG: hypothetical protein ACJ763_01915 [Bdellovibrionia bacterium]
MSQFQHQQGKPTLSEAPQSRGLLAALVYDALGDLLSQVQDGFQPVHLHRAASAEEVMALADSSDTALLFGEVMHPDDAFQLLLSLKQLNSRIVSGQVRVVVHCTLPSKNFIEKLKAYGCTEVITSLEQSDSIVQKARMIAELLLFRRAAQRLPGGKLTSVGLVFMLSEWIAQHGIDYSNMAHLFCACLSTACGGARFEFLAQRDSDEKVWDCIATNDNTASQWMDVVAAGDQASEIRIEWLGNRKGAIVCSAQTELTQEQNRMLQAAADLAGDFVLLAQPNNVLKRSGLKY